MAEPKLNLLILDSHNSYTLAIADISIYPVGYQIVSPTMIITIPNYDSKTLPFAEKSMSVYNSDTLGLTCEDEECDEIPLPDGIYIFKYSIAPAYKYNITKNYLRVYKLMEKFDTAYMRLDIMNCDGGMKREDKRILDEIEFYINGAIAAGNQCANKLAMDLYNKANKKLDSFIHHRQCINC